MDESDKLLDKMIEKENKTSNLHWQMIKGNKRLIKAIKKMENDKFSKF